LGAFTSTEFRAGECVYLEVEDTGKGLDGVTRLCMFEPFFSTKAAGRGLGMSVVLGIVRGHHGALRVSLTIGVGTVIRALLPISTKTISWAPRLVPKQPSHLGKNGMQVTVLLADDEPSVLRFAKAALARVNIKVFEVEDGQAAIDKFRELRDMGKSPQVVLLDATMPLMGGIEAMSKIRELDSEIPIILSSGYTLEGVATRAAKTDCCWFLPKPYGVSELLSMVAHVLTEVESYSNTP
jgi:CheY-like chemotaxis protein